MGRGFKKRNRVRTLIPKDLKTEKEYFEKVGFEFKDSENPNFYEATLPSGWRIKRLAPTGWVWIYDQKGRTRGNYYFDPNNTTIPGDARLNTRYHIFSHYRIPYEKHPFFVVEDGLAPIDKPLCIAGSNTKDTAEASKLKAEEYLNTHYPDWKDPSAYWDN